MGNSATTCEYHMAQAKGDLDKPAKASDKEKVVRVANKSKGLLLQDDVFFDATSHIYIM